MNVLTDVLPEAVEIDGHEYPINTDFRACLKIILAFEDAELTSQERYSILLANLYTQEMPENITKAIELGMKFLNGGDEKKEEDEEEETDTRRLYSFQQDGNFIFAAFKQTHGIDLEKAELHWWKFLALFMDLGSETTFCSLISLRKRVREGTASKEEMREYREHRDIFEIDTRTPEEKAQEDEFMALVKAARENRE